MNKMYNQNSERPAKIVLKGDLILNNVESIYKQLLPESGVTEDAEIEIRDMQKWDVSGVQLLYSFRRHYALQDKMLSFSFSTPEQAALCQDWLDLLNTHI